MRSSELGSLMACLLLATGTLLVPKIELSTVEGLFAASWTFLAVIVAVAFLRKLSRRR